MHCNSLQASVCHIAFFGRGDACSSCCCRSLGCHVALNWKYPARQHRTPPALMQSTPVSTPRRERCMTPPLHLTPCIEIHQTCQSIFMHIGQLAWQPPPFERCHLMCLVCWVAFQNFPDCASTPQLRSCTVIALKWNAVYAMQVHSYSCMKQARTPAVQSNTPAAPDDAFWDKRNTESSASIRAKVLQPSQLSALSPPPPPPQPSPSSDGNPGGASQSPFGLVGMPPPEEASASSNQSQNTQVSCWHYITLVASSLHPH